MDSIRRDLSRYIDAMSIVDTHEHLPAETDRVGSGVDFSTLFSHYCKLDLVSSGMSQRDLEAFVDPETDIEAKWRLFEPHYQLIKNGGYARSARESMERFYGLGDLTSYSDAQKVTERIRAANVPGLYRQVLQDACHIRTSINFNGHPVDGSTFAYVQPVCHLTEIGSRSDLDSIASQLGSDFISLDQYCDALLAYVERLRDEGVRGVKLASAYQRTIEFCNPDSHAAETLFNRIYSESVGWRRCVLGFEESRPLQDYLVHRIAEFAGRAGLAVVFHTGIHANSSSRLADSKPDGLFDLVRRYSSTRFVLLHCGLPFMDEAGVLAKYLPNVYIDLAWVHIISPELAVRSIRSYVDMVPRNKVLGFGGDYHVVEKIYGHLMAAKRNISLALAAKVVEGAMTEAQAHEWIDSMLSRNPANVYGLDI